MDTHGSVPLKTMLSLIRYPQSPALGADSLEVDARLDAAGNLALTYRLEGDLAGLRLPSPETPQRRDGLWSHTCFELFVTAGGQAYREFNFSPAGHWQAYAFGRYRQGGLLDPAQAPDIATEVGDHLLVVSVRLPAVNLPAGPRLNLGLTAVLEGTDGSLAYWALRHVLDRPDFHRAESFTCEVDRSET